jgi:minor fimbrial subunit
MVLSGALTLNALPARATVCQNADGGAKDISYDLSDVFNSANNKPGQIITLAQKSGLFGLPGEALCHRHRRQFRHW